MIGDVLDLRGLVVVRQDHGVALRRQPPDLRSPVRAHLRSGPLVACALLACALLACALLVWPGAASVLVMICPYLLPRF